MMKERILSNKAILITVMKILNQEPDLRVVIRDGFQDPEIFSVVFILENKGLIFNRTNIKKDDPKKGYKKDDVLVSVSN